MKRRAMVFVMALGLVLSTVLMGAGGALADGSTGGTVHTDGIIWCPRC